MQLSVILFLSLLLHQSCDESDETEDEIQQEVETTGGETTTKSIFSLWIRSDGRSINFSGGDFNRSTSFRFEFNLGSSCNCRIKTLGSETHGTLTLSNCSWNFDGPGDPGCSLDEGTSSYHKSGDVLRWSCYVLNRPSPCGIYN